MKKKNYSALLLAYRGKKRINQSELAQMLGVTIQTICRIENNKQYPNAITRYAIDNLLKEQKNG